MRQPHRNIPTLWKVRYQLRPNIITRDTPIYSTDTGSRVSAASTTNELVEAAALQQIHNARASRGLYEWTDAEIMLVFDEGRAS